MVLTSTTIGTFDSGRPGDLERFSELYVAGSGQNSGVSATPSWWWAFSVMKRTENLLQVSKTFNLTTTPGKSKVVVIPLGPKGFETRETGFTIVDSYYPNALKVVGKPKGQNLPTEFCINQYKASSEWWTEVMVWVLEPFKDFAHGWIKEDLVYALQVDDLGSETTAVEPPLGCADESEQEPR